MLANIDSCRSSAVPKLIIKYYLLVYNRLDKGYSSSLHSATLLYDVVSWLQKREDNPRRMKLGGWCLVTAC